jgi:hypothetical protein
VAYQAVLHVGSGALTLPAAILKLNIEIPGPPGRIYKLDDADAAVDHNLAAIQRLSRSIAPARGG